jgi:DNA-binding PadR family transcriptional regulator
MSEGDRPAGDRAPPGEDRLYTRFDPVFFEKTRLSMLTLLHHEGFVSFNRFKLLLESSDGAVYGHIQKLLKAGYIRQKKEIAGDKAQTVYSLSDFGTQRFRQYLEFLEAMLKQERKASAHADQ